MPSIDSLRVDDICKLSHTATEQMKLALEYKRDRIKAAKIIHDITVGIVE